MSFPLRQSKCQSDWKAPARAHDREDIFPGAAALGVPNRSDWRQRVLQRSDNLNLAAGFSLSTIIFRNVNLFAIRLWKGFLNQSGIIREHEDDRNSARQSAGANNVPVG